MINHTQYRIYYRALGSIIASVFFCNIVLGADSQLLDCSIIFEARKNEVKAQLDEMYS